MYEGSVLRECRNKTHAVGDSILCSLRPSDKATMECLQFCESSGCSAITSLDIKKKFQASSGRIIKHWEMSWYLMILALVLICCC